MTLRIIQTIAGTQSNHGGTSRSVPALCDALQSQGVDNHLLTFQPRDPNVECIYPADRSRVHLISESKWGRQYGIGKKLRRELYRLIHEASGVAIVHDHAVWLPSNHHVAKFCMSRNVPRIVSPRGMLGAWALNHGKWKKRLAWALYQRADLSSATAFHATSEQEEEEIRKLGFTQPIAVVPNGIDVPESLPERRSPLKQFLFMSRIHPKKGLVELLSAWKASNVAASGWQLVIAGPDDGGHSKVIDAEIKRLQLSSCVRMVGEVRGADKWQLFADSDYFVLPSFNENFGIAIAEALACGVPVITTTNTPWFAIREKELGWWIPCGHEPLVNAILSAARCPEHERTEAGRRAKAEIKTKYSWQRSASELNAFYQRISERFGI